MNDFKARRERLFDKMYDNSLAVVCSAPIQYRNNDADYKFRQDSYFYYLTGFEESFAIAVLIKTRGTRKYVLFCQEKNQEQERWTGNRVGVLGAQNELGADHAFPIAEAGLKFPQFFKEIKTVYYLVGKQPPFEAKLFSWIQSLQKMQRQGITPPEKYVDLSLILDELRLIKEPQEIEIMQKAASVTIEGHQRAMLKAQPGLYEYHLEAELSYAFYQGGCQHQAYNAIVASGANACVLHYVKNDCQLKAGDLVLIDAGAEYQNYAADVTRTFPVSGKFSTEQQAIYELVLAAQQKAIQVIKPKTPWQSIQQNILEILVMGMIDLGILKGDKDGLIESEAYKPFYMHNSGHWLGLDVHDVGKYKVENEWRPLAENMVLTVEPGLYIDEDSPNVPEKWRGIGVRIEDDILVTADGCNVLTEALPKTVDDITHFMQS